MKRRSMRRKPTWRRQPHGQAILVGNSGKVRRDNRLRQLRVTKTYKIVNSSKRRFGHELSMEFNSFTANSGAISEMSQLVAQYEYLSSLMYSLEKENANNSNTDLLQELKEMTMKCRQELFCVSSVLTGSIPERLNESVQDILNCRIKLNEHGRKVHSSSISEEIVKPKRFTRTNGKANVRVLNHPPRTGIVNGFNKSNQKSFTSSVSNMRNSWSPGGCKSQIFIRMGSSPLQAINIDLFWFGKNLYDVLAQELKEDVTKYNVMFGAKEVDKEKTFFEQGIYHGSTIDLILPLSGGMGRRNTNRRGKKGANSKPKKTRQSGHEPKAWADPEVQRWFEKNNEMWEISIEQVSELMTLTVHEVDMLEKNEWEKISPEYGKMLFISWRKDHKERASSTSIKKGGKVDKSLGGPPDSKTSAFFSNQNTPKSSRKILFGNAEALDETVEQFLIEDFEVDALMPQFGSVIIVTGICLDTLLVQKNLATLFIKDDPQGAANFYNKIKIVFARSEKNKNEINSLLDDLSADMLVGVKGRVEKLNKEDDVENNDSCKMLKFKLVIDSDDHVLFSAETKPPKLTRQLSQSCWPPHALSEYGNELNLKVGDFLLGNDLKMVYCVENTTDEQILQYVVAFKNSFDGEIFVGVKENGEITGMELSSGEVKNWCEKVSKAIGTLLPGANEGADICRDIQEANICIDRRRCFVCVLPLNNDNSKGICWIHVPKGEARVYFIKESDVHAFKRIGAETKRIKDYDHLFNDLESLASRKIEPVPEEDYDEEDEEQDEEKRELGEEYRILEEVKHENQHLELKMIFGIDPLRTIRDKYLARYACGFLNSEGGSILFGVEEDEQAKLGHVVGIVLSMEERKQLVKKTAKILRKFYPPVSRSEFHIKFHRVYVPPDWIVKDEGEEKMFAMITGPSKDIMKKWLTIIQYKLARNSCAIIPIGPQHSSQRYCVVAKKQTFDGGNLNELLNQFKATNPEFELRKISGEELNTILENICVIQLYVSKSPYPIHMVKTIDTYVFSNDKEKQLRLCTLSQRDLMDRFKIDSSSEFNVNKFLKHVNSFDSTGDSYILVTSPFYFSENENERERDLYGLVIPKWTLTIDLDQYPNQTGHLYELFQTLNDNYQLERNRFLKTPEDSKLDLNPDHGICWLAARGYQENEKSLSEKSHAKWNKTHRSRVRELLDEDLKTSVKPNRLNIVVLWNEGHEELLKSLQTILEDLISLNGEDSTVITFVCATPKACSDICNKIILPLQEDNWETISEDRVHIAPPYVLARYLSLSLPSPYRPEDEYQVPHKTSFPSGGCQIIPQILPLRLRQSLAGRINVMYMKKVRKVDDQTLNEERKNFFSGCAITNVGLHGDIGIQRAKMDDLEQKFKALSSDRKSRVSLIFVKTDRGAGSTTMCLQFLHQQHKSYPCAQLIDIKDDLVGHIKELNKKTRLPLILFVDENVARWPEFLDFKKTVECRHANVTFILIQPPESAGDSSLYGPSPCKEVELRRKLDEQEMDHLINELTVLAKEKKKELLKFKKSGKKDVKTFAQFSLLAFGENFKGLKDYVEFRLNLANEGQKNILAFLSLTHVFTDYSLPANAFAHFLQKKDVILENELQDKYVKELLSPPLKNSDCRRISFYEVANEILQQLSAASSAEKSGVDQYWNYIKSVSVTMAQNVLSKYITTKKIDRLTRKLFVTSEYESEEFSSLIQEMREQNRDTARDTLKDLANIFVEKKRHSSIRAHLLANLAKYQMLEYKVFSEAKNLIETAVREQKQDSLLHHIHGDIIRLHVLDLVENMKTKEDMETIVRYASESSKCFEFVRSKKPHMSHGYIFDAMVRIAVMQAGIKLMEGNSISFVDYLIERIDAIKKCDDEDVSPNSRYLLSLIADAHEYLDERCIDVEQKENWKKIFFDCIGGLKNLTRLCDKIEQEKDCSSFVGCSSWLYEVLLQTKILHVALEIEKKVSFDEQFELKLNKMEEYGSNLIYCDRFMKFWIRFTRQRKTVPDLLEVKEKVNEWSMKVKRKGVASPQAEFYNFVVHVLMALKDPFDHQKMDKAVELTEQQCKRYNKQEYSVLPYEWLQPKGRENITSIDCLRQHDDLIKRTNISSKSIEDYLYHEHIMEWKGTITNVYSARRGTITFKERLPVQFIPENVSPFMPSLNDEVTFCLSFDGFGLSAWRVMCEAGAQPGDLSDIVSGDDGFSSEYSEPEDVDEDVRSVAPSLSFISIQEPDEKRSLGDHKDYERRDRTLKSGIKRTGTKTDRTCAADIRVLEDENLHKSMLGKLQKKRHSLTATSANANESDTRREEGSVVKYDDRGFGFIRRDGDKSGRDLFFSRRSLTTRGQLPKIRDRVEFSVAKDAEGCPVATDILVQNKSISSNSWGSFIGAGIQEGFVNSTTDDGGTINSSKVTGSKKNLHFSNRDILNNPKKVYIRTKVHFEVRKRGGRCVAVKINVIDTPEEMTQAEGGKSSFPSN